MGWYNDKISDGTAKLLMAGAGAGAKALGHLAKIPLASDERKARDRKLDNEEEAIRSRLIASQMKAGATVEAATLRANAVMNKAKLDREGTSETAKSRIEVSKTNAGSRKYSSDTQGMIQASRSADNAAKRASDSSTQKGVNRSKEKVASLQLRGKGAVKPKDTIVYNADGTIEKRTVVKPYKKKKSGANFLIDMEKKAKKHGAR